MPALDKQKRYAEEAAAAYKVFKARIETEKTLTREEKIARLEMFLDSHVSIFDEYYEEAVQNGGVPNANKLSDDASLMAKDIAALFGTSYTGRHFMTYRSGQSAENRARILDTHGRELLGTNARDGDARQSYMAPSQAKFDKMMRRTALIFNDKDPAVQAEIQAAGRRDAWASGPRTSPKQDANTAKTIAAARVATAQSNYDQKENELRAAEASIESLRQMLEEAQAKAAQEKGAAKAGKAQPPKPDEGEKNAGETARMKFERLRKQYNESQNRLTALRDARDKAVQELAEARSQKRAADEAADNPEAQRTLQRSDRTEGLQADQMRGIRDISAFLYRNTMHGKDATRRDRGRFVDGVLRCSPRQKLLMFYLIERDRIHGSPTEQELLDSQNPQAYIPNLEQFKPHIFGGMLRGFFGRMTGNSLNWDKLSDVSQNTKAMMPLLYRLLTARALNQDPALARQLANAEPDPELADAIQRVVDVGNIVIRNPKPSQADLDKLRTAVQALNAYIASQEKSTSAQIKEAAGDTNFWLAYISKPSSILGQFLSESAKILGASNADKLLTGSTVLSWDANVVGAIGLIASFITLFSSFAELVRSGGAGTSAAAKTLQALNFIKDLGAAGSAGYNTVTGFMKLAGSKLSGTATVAGGALGAAVGLITAIVGISRTASADKKMMKLEYYQQQLDEFKPEGLTKDQKRILKEKKAFLRDIAEKQRMSEHRQGVAGAYQAAGGTLTTISGALLAGGVTAFAAAGVAAAAFVVGIVGAVHDYRLKKAEKRVVIDKYLGIDKVFEAFKRNNSRRGQDFNKTYGSDEDVKTTLRDASARNLGFPSTDKLFSFIMWRFATALYSAAFLKNGQVVTQHDKDAMSSLERNERRMFTNLIKSMGMRVIYPQNPGDKPAPDANAIYKTLMK